MQSCGISVESFLELLRFYLESTIVGWCNHVYVQRSGICIGSKVAPLVSDIFLAHVDRVLERDLEGLAIKIFMYVDDYLVLCGNYDPTRKMVDILKAFKRHAFRLTFMSKALNERTIQFLDLLLKFEQNHVCWLYSPRSKKPLLNSSSARSRIAKYGIVVNCLRSAILFCFQSCFHLIESSFGEQLVGPKNAGYGDGVIGSACLQLLDLVKKTCLLLVML